MGRNRAVLMIAMIASGVMSVAAQTPMQKPTFEAAAIKPSQDAPGSTSGIRSTPGRITGRYVTLKRCIRGAYDIPETQVLGGPKWVDEDRYDIEANASGPAGDHELMIMLQSLLTERFHLQFHREQQQVSGYALVNAKGGTKVERSQSNSARTSASRGRIEAQASTIADLAQKLSEALKMPTVDFTDLDGRFDFTLSWDPDDPITSASSRNPSPVSGPSVFAALEEQLGLKLESRKVPVEVLVSDKVEKPTLN